MPKNIDYTLYAITDRTWLKDGESLCEAVRKAIEGGASVIQLREKVLVGDKLKQLALEVQSVCNQYKVPLIINDDARLAKEINADGVHIGQNDMDIEAARKILGSDKIIGVTAKTIDQAVHAQSNGADYLGSGAVFGSATKLDAKPMTLDMFQTICESVDIPVVAIGGIDETNIEGLRNRKMAGFAVVSAIFAKDDIEAATRELREVAEDILHN